MAVAGIIAEYNPLQNRDIQLLQYAKTTLKASLVVVVMCGDFTHQGTPAMVSKYERAALAVKYGADMVIELPVVAVTADPKIYAVSAVSLLRSTNMVTHLLYSSDAPMAQFFQVAAAAPMGAIRRIDPVPIITSKEEGKAIPADVMKMLRFQSQFKMVVRSADISPLLHERLISISDFSEFMGFSPELSLRLNGVKGMFVEFESFTKTLKSKEMTQEEVNRILLHILLNIKYSDLSALGAVKYAPYIHIIGYSTKGTALMSVVKGKNALPFFMTAEQGFMQMDEQHKKLLEHDVYASDLYRAMVTNKSGKTFTPELTRKFELKR